MKVAFKFLLVMSCVVPTVAGARNVVSRAARVTNTPTSGYTYNYMYPYLNNQMRQTLNPGNTNTQGTGSINAVVKTAPMPVSTTTGGTQNAVNRRVVARSGRMPTTNVARAATTTGGAIMARSGAMAPASVSSTRTGVTRRISPRGSVARNSRTDNSGAATTINSTSGTYVSSGRCLADYMDCMNSYCARQDTPYNRCFCSSKLSQIESTYQPQIDSLIQQILRAQDNTSWTDAEMSEYWRDKMGQFVDVDSWARLDDALNIDWPDADLRMQGQDAYNMGHEYCVSHLVNCAYATQNMRDVYRSEIAGDCSRYEKSLNKLKTALESALDTYSE